MCDSIGAFSDSRLKILSRLAVAVSTSAKIGRGFAGGGDDVDT